MTRASLIVLNYNGRDVLRECVHSLLAASAANDEVIVVDNASTDGSDNVQFDDFRVTWIRRTVNNFIFGLNDGLAHARGEVVAFLNNDIVADEDFVERCLVLFDRPDVFAVCPRIMQMDGLDQGSLTSGAYRRGLWFYEVHPHNPNAKETFFAVGGQSFFDRAKLNTIGSIDPLLRPMYHEDIELSIRAWKAGYSIRYATDAVVHHVGGHSSSRRFTPTQLRSFVRQNQFLTVWKNTTDIRFWALHFACLPLRLATALAKRDWGTLIGFAKALGRLTEIPAARRSARTHFKLKDSDVAGRVAPVSLGISGSHAH